MTIEWGAAERPKQGQSISGDAYLVLEYQPNRVLAAVIDGLGGGAEAALAAQRAREILSAHPQLPLTTLLQRCHTALNSTRGAVAGLLSLDLASARMSFCGVGNIGTQIYSSTPIKPISRSGIIGYRLPALLEMSYSFPPESTFVLYSDGISSRFSLDPQLSPTLGAQRLATTILEQHGKYFDDATVIVVRV